MWSAGPVRKGQRFPGGLRLLKNYTRKMFWKSSDLFREIFFDQAPESETKTLVSRSNKQNTDDCLPRF
jgi:hypothetical protein